MVAHEMRDMRASDQYLRRHAADVHAAAADGAGVDDGHARTVLGRTDGGRERPRTTAHDRDMQTRTALAGHRCPDRKSTRLNSSHGYISYAVFCLKKKKSSRARGSGEYSTRAAVVLRQ